MQTTYRKKAKLRVVASLIVLSGLGLSSLAADPTPGKLPSAITELSVSAKESFDNNVYGSDEVLQAGYPNLVKQSAYVSSIGVRFLFSASQLAGLNKDLLILGYNPTYNNYSDLSDETNTQHRFLLQSKGKSGSLSWAVDNTATYIDGSKESLRYTGYSSCGIVLPRERRAQWQDAGKFSLKYDVDQYFVRAAGSITFYDLLTAHHVATGAYAGWLNFVDRYDVNGGFDGGWKYSKDTALTVGWRTGHQYQQQFYWVPSLTYNSSNDYNRLLVGIEGKPLDALALNLVVGPDFRKYTAPVQNLGVTRADQMALYIETNATLTVTPDDALTITGKQWRWVSSTGRVSYDDRNWIASWKHTFDPSFAVVWSSQYQQGQYALYPAAISTTARNDTLFTHTLQLQWTVVRNLAVTADYSWQRAINLITTGAISGREYHRDVYSVGAKYTF